MRRRAASVLFWASAKLHRFSHWLEDQGFAINAAEMMRPHSEGDTFIAELWAKPEYVDLPTMLNDTDTIHIPRRSLAVTEFVDVPTAVMCGLCGHSSAVTKCRWDVGNQWWNCVNIGELSYEEPKLRSDNPGVWMEGR